MKLRQRLGISLRMYFTLARYSVFLDVFLFMFLSNLSVSENLCFIIVFGILLLWFIWCYSFKCPECNTRFFSFYSYFSKYKTQNIFSTPKKCSCCGLDFDSV